RRRISLTAFSSSPPTTPPGSRARCYRSTVGNDGGPLAKQVERTPNHLPHTPPKRNAHEPPDPTPHPSGAPTSPHAATSRAKKPAERCGLSSSIIVAPPSRCRAD